MRILLLPTSESHSAPLPPRFHSYFHPDIIRLPIPANVAVPTALAESGIEFGSSAHILFTLKTPLPGARGVKACHGAHVIDALGPRDEPADGMYLVEEERNLPREGRMLVMATADCLAVALHARVDGYVLAALTHAGWRGYSQGILLESLARLQRAADAKGIPQGKWLPHLTVVISPAIAGTCYPCGDDVRDALETHVKARLERLARFSRVASLVEECLDVTNTLSLVPYPGEDEAEVGS